MPSLMQRAVALRRSLPEPLRRLIDRSLTAERGPVAWLQERLLVRTPVPVALRPESDLPVRLLIAPLNYAGQAWEWARTAGDGVEAQCMAVDFGAPFGFKADAVIPAVVFTASRTWRRDQRAALGQYSHVLIESLASPLGRGNGAVVLDDAKDLGARGVKLALLCHGSEVRVPSQHALRHSYSPFQSGYPELEYLERTARANLGVISDFDGPVFVSTPDLLVDVPDAIWLPVVVDPERWSAQTAVDRAVPVVMHAPSAGPVKGSEFVVAAAQELHDAGLIEFRALHGVPSAQMPARVAEADVVVDQLLIGSYGVAACEAMAAGRVVVGNVDEQVREHVRAATGLEIPIVQATPDSVHDVLRRLASDPAERTAVAAEGPDFIRAVHAGEFTPRALAAFLDPERERRA